MLNEPQLKPQAPGRWRGGQGKKRQERGDVAGQKKARQKKGQQRSSGANKEAVSGEQEKKKWLIERGLGKKGESRTSRRYCTRLLYTGSLSSLALVRMLEHVLI